MVVVIVQLRATEPAKLFRELRARLTELPDVAPEVKLRLVDAGVMIVCSQDCAQELVSKGKREWDRNRCNRCAQL